MFSNYNLKAQQQNSSLAPGLSQTIQELVIIAQRAGKHALSLRGSLTIEKKGALDVVTQADKEAEGMVLEGLKVFAPGVEVISEEQDSPSIKSKSFYVVDPIDGTYIYTRGYDHWGVAIARVDGGELREGVIFFPALDVTVVAEYGKGCFVNGQRVHLKGKKELGQALLCTEIASFLDDENLNKVMGLRFSCAGIFCILSATGGMLELLRERVDSYIHMQGAKIWDFAACAIAVTEAGGVVTDSIGQELSWDKIKMNVVFSADSGIHEKVIKGLRGTICTTQG